ANLLIFVGLLLMILGVVGILGAVKENQILLITFFVLVFLAFSFLMAAGLWAVAWKEKLGALLSKKLKSYVDALEESNGTGIKTSKAKTMDWIQEKFQCCGDASANEYSTLPDSCSRNANGCYDAIVTTFKSNIHKVAALGITVGFFSVGFHFQS
ncbi:cd9 antigen, partial [Cichlidogyrus casuarinus]